MPENGKAVNKILTRNDDKIYGWTEAIEDVKHELLKNKVRRVELEAAMKVFMARLEAGEPWPGQIEI